MCSTNPSGNQDIPISVSNTWFPYFQVGIIDTGIALGHEDLQRNVNKKCEDFVNGDHTCDEGKIKGPSKGEGSHC